MKRLDRALEDCLTRLANGEALEACLNRYPEDAVELSRLLATVAQLERGRAIGPTPVLKARTRARLTAHMRAQPHRRGSWLLLHQFKSAFNFAFGLMAIVILVLATGTVLAQRALPGEPLYGWKMASEKVWRMIYADPLAVDLILSDRRVEELTSVAGDPEAEQLARHAYQQSLAELKEYATSDSQELISQALNEQKDDLTQAGLAVPALDQLLTEINVEEVNLELNYHPVTIEAGRAIYTLTLTNHGPAELVTATVRTTLSPQETLVSVSEAKCDSSKAGSVACTVANLIKDEPRQVTIQTTVTPCYAGPLSNTATVTGTDNFLNINPEPSVVAESVITLPFPRLARVIYVQSNRQTHSLGMINSTADLVNDNLHQYAAAPAWSPGGTKLAFFGQEGISQLGGLYSQGNGLWVADMVNAQLKNPTLLWAEDHLKNIAWSPDGAKLAFEVGPPGINHDIVIIDAKDGRLVSRFPGQQPAWSPNSQKLVVRIPNSGLWQADFKGGLEKQITDNGTDSYPAWSPDGQSLAFSSDRDGNWEIYLFEWANGQISRLTHRPSTDTTPVFDPCGREIYLRTDHYEGWSITVMNLNGGEERQVQAGVGPSDDWGLARPAIY